MHPLLAANRLLSALEQKSLLKKRGNTPPPPAIREKNETLKAFLTSKRPALPARTTSLRDLKAAAASVVARRRSHGSALLESANTAIVTREPKSCVPTNIDPSQITEELLTAAQNGQQDKVRELLDLGASINARNEKGNTALIEATCNNHPLVVQLLLARGADVNATNLMSDSAIALASSQGYNEVAELLVGAKAGVEILNDLKRTPQEYGRADSAAGLITAGSDFHAAACGGLCNLIDRLLCLSFDLNTRNPYGSAPREEQIDPLLMLIGAGADVNAVSKLGHTALFWGRRERTIRSNQNLARSWSSAINKQTKHCRTKPSACTRSWPP